MMVDINLLLLWGGAFKKLHQNEIIFHEGNPGHFYYQLHQGTVRWVNINDDGTEFIQSVIAPGESFGEFVLFDNLPYSSTAIACKDSVVIRLDKIHFLQLLKDNPDVEARFTKLFVERLRFKSLLLNEISNHTPEHMIAALLSYLKDAHSDACYHCNEVKLTRQQIANMTGLRVETVIRTMQKMKEKGMVAIEKGKVFVSSPLYFLTFITSFFSNTSI